MTKMAMGVLALMSIDGAVNAAIVEANLADGLQTSASGLYRVGGLPADRAIASGDTYSAGLLGLTATGSAAFVTSFSGRVTSFTFNNNNAHGTLIGSGATVNIQSIDLGDVAPGVRRVVVACFTTNTTNLWLSGITIGGVSITQGRFDVGSTLLGGNGLLWNNLPGAATSVSIFSALWSPSNAFAAPIATSAVLPNQATGGLPSSGSAVAWNGVVGFSGVINEVDMVFDISYVPTPGTGSLLVAGGLFAIRRRR